MIREIGITVEHLGHGYTDEDVADIVAGLKRLGWNTIAKDSGPWKFDTDEQRANFESDFDDLLDDK
jgi:hypothetical protein